ncbi:hypothetical protein Afer_0701 [Acidimicrobium ferrooxidans DSM 10331]|uniref:Phosphodiester glycosidase domain-containing protein n=1 Tax=Acidimicrobium ferrooxidans (strain DSM 10331 / JCM 15462 / NBRC 103882 / ICP) TaxID=525909 RepID=C7LY43_ACIFD|nr:phosphodiester glycosidase family protein [Acidimicrobium ferrooxidans]ACU53651.1 hypothetical protein Afer_0701 [Acidimicrobium ferrooxidans DSM 10331]
MSTVQRSAPSRPRIERLPRRRRSRTFRLVRAVVLVVVLAMASWAGIGTVTMPGSASLGVKFVEWVRGHGGASFVAFLENTWYAINQPPTGGKPPRHALTPVGHVDATASGPLPAPARVIPFAKPPLANEGVWTPEGPLVNGVPTLYVTLMRPDPIHTSLVAGVAWMDTRLLRFIQYAGAQEPPGGGPWPYMAPITNPVAADLVAAFNSGFRMQDANGGYYAYGRTAVPLRNGAASFVISTSGVPTIETWTHGNHVPKGIAVVRQNLIPLISNGRINPLVNSTNFAIWGATVGNQLLVWRSGVGITRNGALVYVTGPGLSVASLARLLARVGAVNAMELDINSDWTDFFYFNHQLGQAASPSDGYRLVYDMLRPPQRYFEGTARDFVVAEVRPSLANG